MKRLKKGDVFIYKTTNNQFRFFQFIGKDKTNLDSDVVRIFKTTYENDMIAPSIIINGIVESYVHTFVNWGGRMGLWSYYAGIGDIGSEHILFRSSKDYGLYPGKVIVSDKWEVWLINGPKVFVGKLPPQYYDSYIGDIYGPEVLADKLDSNVDPISFYPQY